MKHYKITIKVENEEPIITEFIGNDSYRELVEFLDLRNPDVEYYSIEVEKLKDDEKARID